jgi:hypothetical protein
LIVTVRFANPERTHRGMSTAIGDATSYLLLVRRTGVH